MADSLPLRWLSQWGPFRLDALGIVTMLGASEVDASVGRLVFSRYTEYLPILGASVIAGNHFTRPLPGFTLYNLNDGITTTDWPGWLARYLQALKIHQSVSTMSFKLCDPFPMWWEVALAAIIGFLVNVAILALAAIEGDWWGLVNVFSMLASVAVRSLLVSQNRKALDSAVERASKADSRDVRIICILPDGRMLTVSASAAFLYECVVKKPGPANVKLYKALQLVGWIFFAVHVISIGMSSLAVQLATVVVLCGSTVLVTCNVGCLEKRIGNRITIERHEELDQRRMQAFPKADNGSGDRRQNAYVFLEPNENEVESMLLWNLLPHRRNGKWWEVFEAKRQAWRFKKAEIEMSKRPGRTWESQRTIVANYDPEKSPPP